jgi:hypothetical protein
MLYPDFFQKQDEEALRNQVIWAIEHFGFDREFYERFLAIDRRTFDHWRSSEGELTDHQRNLLNELWILSRHLYSYCDYNETYFKEFFISEHNYDPYDPQQRYSPFTPPWAGQSVRSYIALGHLPAVQKVNDWLDFNLSGNLYYCNETNRSTHSF